jgi:HlyD family secretion protein
LIREELIDYTRRKKFTGKLLLLFTTMMVLLTFFSNTIHNFTLPRITVEKPTSGALIKEISGEGTIEAKSVFEQFIEAGTNPIVKEVHVQAGDIVKKDQPIITLDIDDLKSNLQDENAKYKQLQIALGKLKDSSNLTTLNNNIETALGNKNQKTKTYQDAKALYDSGFESANNLQNAKTAMEDAQRNYDSALQSKETFIKNNQKDIENAELNMEIEARKIDALNKQVAKNGVYIAPADGMITELNFNKGALANSSKALFKLAETSGCFQLTITADDNLADFIKSGDAVDVYIASLGDKKVAGNITQTKINSKDGDKKDLLIDVKDDMLQGGEKAKVTISKKTKQYSTLVPNSAVYTDSDGSYVFVVKEKKAPLGTESYVQKVTVTALDSDSTKSAIVNGITPMDKIVTKSTKTLSDGDRAVIDQ